MDEMTVRQEMINDAKSVNKFLTDEILQSKTNAEIFNNTHPDHRPQYKKILTDNNLWDKNY